MEHSQTDVLTAVYLGSKVFIPRRLGRFGTCCCPSKSDVVYVHRHVWIDDGWGGPCDEAHLVSCGKVGRAEIVRFNHCQLQCPIEEDHCDNDRKYQRCRSDMVVAGTLVTWGCLTSLSYYLIYKSTQQNKSLYHNNYNTRNISSNKRAQ